MTFKDLSLIEPLLRALETVGYERPTPIQQQAIPVVLSQHDLLGCAQTGTGKTAAFALPMLQLLSKNPPRQQGASPIRALILTPTRELAIQIGESFTDYGKNLRIRNTVIFGGVNQNPQTQTLKRGVDVLIATPGRLLDLMNQGFVSLRDIEIFVLDEADRMLDMGFIHDVKKVISKLPQKRQTLFFSATMPPEISDLAHSILTNPQRVEVTPVSSTAEKIDQAVYFVEKADKKRLLIHLLKEHEEIKSALVFTRTKHGANKVAADLHKAGVLAEAIHGNKSQNARQAALKNFKSGKTRVLVATDIAARGIDIDELSHVINFELPNVPETYVHRIGRTGRAGLSGVALSFCEAEELPYLRDIQKLTGQKVPVADHNPFAADLSAPSAPQPKPQPQRQAGRNRGGQPGRSGNNQRQQPGQERTQKQAPEPVHRARPAREENPRQQQAAGVKQPANNTERKLHSPKQQHSQPEKRSGQQETAFSSKKSRFASILEVATIEKQPRPPRPADQNRQNRPGGDQQEKQQTRGHGFNRNRNRGK